MHKVLILLAILIMSSAYATAEDAPWSPPPQNALKQKTPPAVPDPGPSVERAKLFVEALRQDKPEIALPFFFPKEEFRRVKAIKDPDRYHKRLVRIYDEDLRAMRKTLKDPASIEFVGFELGRQKNWVERGKEGNAYPYWANYKASVKIMDAGKEKVLKLRVIINWGDQWYVTHLTNKPPRSSGERPDRGFRDGLGELYSVSLVLISFASPYSAPPAPVKAVALFSLPSLRSREMTCVEPPFRSPLPLP